MSQFTIQGALQAIKEKIPSHRFFVLWDEFQLLVELDAEEIRGEIMEACRHLVHSEIIYACFAFGTYNMQLLDTQATGE